MKSLSKMNMNELRQMAVELGVDQNRTYGVSKQGLVIMINAQKDINTAIECGLIEADTTNTENDKEENTMTQSTFTTNSGMTYSISGTRYFKAGLDSKKTQISKTEYELAQDLYEKEQAAWEAEADAERKAREDKMMADAKVTEDAVNGLENLSEDEKATIEPAEAELLNNVRKEKKAKEGTKKTARKPRKSKDIAYEGHGVTLTAKQVDFINHLPDTCFWEMGLDSVIWCDVLVDDIGGQFAEKPMTVGAMISTLCEKHLGIRGKERREGRKVTNFALTELGKEVAKELGLE